MLLMGVNCVATRENNMQVPQIIKNRTTYDLAIPRQGIYQKKKKMKTITQKDTCTSIAAFFTIMNRGTT